MEDRLLKFKDPNFRFDPDLHMYYYVNPDTGLTEQTFVSVTQFLSRFKEPFNSRFWASRKAKARGVPTQTVLAEWDAIAKTATDLGTQVHEWIENFYSDSPPSVPDEPGPFKERVEAFVKLHSSRLHRFTPVYQELRVFSRKWGIAGTTDAVFRLGDQYYVGDWKTNKAFTTDADPEGRKKRLLWPFDDMWDNALNNYSIQLSLYRLIMEVEAGFLTNGAFLVWIGPLGKLGMYQTVDLRERLYDYLNKQ